LRKKALHKSKMWMMEHIERTEGLAAIYPAMMNSIFALMALGHGVDDPLTAREIKEFSRFELKMKRHCVCSRAFRRCGTR